MSDDTKATYATPPWRYAPYYWNRQAKPDGFDIFDASGNAIADLPRTYAGNGDRVEANARTMAYAPVLLEAAQELISARDAIGDADSIERSRAAWRNLVAVVKATKGQS